MNYLKKKISSKQILILILLLTAFLRFFRLDFPNKYVFDEVYHAFTAKEYLAGHKEAWEWWTTPPPGVAYEWTHPPLAKEIMTISMFILNTRETWAYRLPGALLGILSVYLVYLLGLKLLNNQTASLLAAFVFSLDGLNFVQSRTGMNDIYYVTFLLGSLLLLLNKRFILSAVLAGLALSSKWAAVYSYLIFIPLLLYSKQYRFIGYFIIIPPIIYFLSYLPFFLLGHSPTQFIQLQQQMWWYHTSLKATHDYTSPWWSWPLNLYPVWYFVDYQKERVANIFASGNPILFWVGSIAVILTVIESVKKKVINLFLISLGFFVFWLPWALSPRIMFLYHFSPSIPFLSLALGYQLSNLLKHRNERRLAFVILLLIIVTFALLYPFITAIHIPREYVKAFFLFNLSKNPF
ncbi:phospholipid carrier-dependent glycosyltransferase [Candidatus Daviesbacteria bacterium]|nr:phospholipid carrier-dependent glycosyltransferase [Candidatus Daviesbacteria bacterium]